MATNTFTKSSQARAQAPTCEDTTPTVGEEYTEFIRKTSWYSHVDEDSLAELNYLIIGLAGETGELADVFKKIIRVHGLVDGDGNMVGKNALSHDKRGLELIDELGDVLWYLVRIADILNLRVGDLMILNTFKLYNRIRQTTDSVMLSRLGGTPEWPLTIPYEGVSKSMQDIESLITNPSASTSTDTDTS